MKATTIRIDDDIIARIDQMAKNLSRSRSWVIKNALGHFLEYEEWFIHEVKEALDEVDRDEIASDEEVTEQFKKWGVNAD